MAERSRKDIEGLRGAAILCVVLFHAGVMSLAGGFVGVDVFFVLSGFFITGLLVKELAGSGSIDVARFYGARLLRLIPLMLVVIAATLAVVMTLYAPIDRASIASGAAGAAVSVNNIGLALTEADYFGSGQNPLLHLWSLAVEVQFYLLWPLVLLALAGAARKRGAVTAGSLLSGLLIVGALSFAASLWLTAVAQPWGFFNLPARIWEFALGGILSVIMMDEKLIEARTGSVLQFAGVGALLLAVWTYDGSMHYPGAAALLPALGAAALIIGGAAAPASTVSRALSASWLRWLGGVSYGWYLWHWPLVGFAEVVNPQIGVVGKLVWSGAALGLAVLTLRWVETPARSRATSYSPRTQLLATLGACGLVMSLALVAEHRAVTRASTGVQRTFAAARVDRFAKSCWATTIDDFKGPCAIGDVNSDTTIAILGDSHAEHWLGGFDAAGRGRGWKIMVFVKGGCPATDTRFISRGRREEYYRECNRFRAAVLNQIVAMRPHAVILSSWDHYVPADGSPSRWQVTASAWRDGLRRTYTRFSSAGITTIVMRDVPQVPFDVPACLSRQAAGLPFAASCTFNRDQALHRSGFAAQNSAAAGLDVRFVDMNDVVCPTRYCSPTQDGLVKYTDDNHLTASFSSSLAGVLGARIFEAMRGVGGTVERD